MCTNKKAEHKDESTQLIRSILTYSVEIWREMSSKDKVTTDETVKENSKNDETRRDTERNGNVRQICK